MRLSSKTTAGPQVPAADRKMRSTARVTQSHIVVVVVPIIRTTAFACRYKNKLCVIDLRMCQREHEPPPPTPPRSRSPATVRIYQARKVQNQRRAVTLVTQALSLRYRQAFRFALLELTCCA